MRSPEDNSGATGAADVKADVKPEDNQVIAFPRFRPEDATLRLTDGREAAPASPAAPPKRKRDLRIDVFRGLALATIFIDHIPGNPYEHATLRNFGFSDAAEGFFLMSGIAAGIAYAGRFMPGPLAQNGAWAAIAPVSGSPSPVPWPSWPCASSRPSSPSGCCRWPCRCWPRPS